MNLLTVERQRPGGKQKRREANIYVIYIVYTVTNCTLRGIQKQ